mmetsp:Transcript_14013/g.23806  ORF Transcript_14013/g.23806 Transcript_14013/m.23806 type:complete len:293 (+) Transcript_14013:368-1246(+)
MQAVGGTHRKTVVDKSNNGSVQKSLKTIDEETINNHIEELVKRQVTKQLDGFNQTQSVFNGAGAAEWFEKGSGNMMGMTVPKLNLNQNSQFEMQELNNTRRTSQNVPFDQRSNMSRRTVMKTKPEFLNEPGRQNQMRDTNGYLIPVGIQKKEVIKDEKAKEMLNKVLGTETLVDQILEMIGYRFELDQPEWPEDAHPNPKLMKNLSYSKMLTEVNHREPRYLDEGGITSVMPIWGTSFGWLASDKEMRKSDADQLGMGINLYMKTMKFLTLLFALMTLISIPPLLIYSNGGN